MSDVEPRLLRCFAAVFPNLPAGEIADASQERLPAWDSLGNVTLLGVIEDEFGVELPLDQLETLTSFQQIAHFLRTTGA